MPSSCISDDSKSSAFYALVIRLFQSILRSGLLVVDDDHIVLTSLQKVIQSWPTKFSFKATELIDKIKDQQKIALLSHIDSQSFLHQPKNNTCVVCEESIRKSCLICIKGFEFLMERDVILLSEDCKKWITEKVNLVNDERLIVLEEYPMSEAITSKLDHEGYSLKYNEWDKKSLEKEVLTPLFQDAKHIFIYDRWLGRESIHPKFSNYQKFIEWIADVYFKRTRYKTGEKAKGNFEICCGILPDLIKTGIKRQQEEEKNDIDLLVEEQEKLIKKEVILLDALKRIKELEKNLQERIPNASIIVKYEDSRKQLRHNRYLITNQSGICIDRGFDIFSNKEKSLFRDFDIGFCPDRERIKEEFMPNNGLPRFELRKYLEKEKEKIENKRKRIGRNSNVN